METTQFDLGILTILLVILAMYALLYISRPIVFRIQAGHLAYPLGARSHDRLTFCQQPLVNWLEQAFQFRWKILPGIFHDRGVNFTSCWSPCLSSRPNHRSTIQK